MACIVVVVAVVVVIAVAVAVVVVVAVAVVVVAAAVVVNFSTKKSVPFFGSSFCEIMYHLQDGQRRAVPPSPDLSKLERF